MSLAHLLRKDPERLCIANEERAMRRLDEKFARSGRPNDGPERAAVRAATDAYAAAHGPYEAFTLLTFEASRFAPPVRISAPVARERAERLFKRGGRG